MDPLDQFRRHFVLWQVLADPRISVRDLEREALRVPFPLVSRSSISRLMQSMKINTGHTVKISPMTKAHKKYRAKWCEEIQRADIWQLPWLFTDEASVQDDPNRPFIHRVPGVVLPGYFQTFKSHPNKVMVWGGIAEGYKSPLMKVDGMINQAKYQELLLRSGLFESMDRI
jgi:hypothetical protein